MKTKDAEGVPPAEISSNPLRTDERISSPGSRNREQPAVNWLARYRSAKRRSIMNNAREEKMRRCPNQSTLGRSVGRFWAQFGSSGRTRTILLIQPRARIHDDFATNIGKTKLLKNPRALNRNPRKSQESQEWVDQRYKSSTELEFMRTERIVSSNDSCPIEPLP